MFFLGQLLRYQIVYINFQLIFFHIPSFSFSIVLSKYLLLSES